MRAVGDQRVGARSRRVPTRARHREDLAVVLDRAFRGDAGAATHGGLDDDDHVGEAGDDAVADRELLAAWLHAVAELAHEQPAATDAVEEHAVASWVHDVETGRDHTDDGATDVERAFVRGGVDADREPTHDGDARGAEHRADLARVGQAVRCGGTRADDRHPRPVEHVGDVAFGEQHRRALGHVVADRDSARRRRRRHGCRGARACGGCGRRRPRRATAPPTPSRAARSSGRARAVRSAARATAPHCRERAHRPSPSREGGAQPRGRHVGEAREHRRRRARWASSGDAGGRRAYRKARSRHVAPEQRRGLDVGGGDLVGVVEVGDRAGNPPDSRRAASGEHTRLDQVAPGIGRVGGRAVRAG